MYGLVGTISYTDQSSIHAEPATPCRKSCPGW
jgi:hypothetical protein